jgi:hypothetical protein
VHLRAPAGTWPAAAAGVGAAVTGHLLDRAGLLPFVHETAAVRTAMSPVQVAGWLLLAGVLAALAAATRPLVVGAPVAAVVSGTPELLGRHDPGAVLEPAALLGALLQVLLVVAVVALAVALERRVLPLRITSFCAPVAALPSSVRRRLAPRLVDATAAPRGPPVVADTFAT